MKGISLWIWIIGGIIVGFILFTIFIQFLSYITRTREVELGKSSFDELTIDAKNVCKTIGGAAPTKLSKKFVFPEAVTDVYATANIRSNIPTGEKSYGKFMCMKIFDETICQDVQCEVEIANINNTPSLTTTISRILGRVGSQEYHLEITKNTCGVSILEPGDSPVEYCVDRCANVANLVNCQDHNIVSLIGNNTLVMTDFTPIFDCCDNYTATVPFLKNVAKFFGGAKILIIWESNFANPNIQKFKPVNDALNASGFEIIGLKHRQKLADANLQGMDQIWLYLPGWCSGQADVQRTVECTDFVEWTKEEFDLIKAYLNSGGKLFIVTDYSPYTTQTIVNGMLTSIGYAAKVLDSNVCGSQGIIVRTTDIEAHSITEGIQEFDFLATSEITC